MKGEVSCKEAALAQELLAARELEAEEAAAGSGRSPQPDGQAGIFLCGEM